MISGPHPRGIAPSLSPNSTVRPGVARRRPFTIFARATGRVAGGLGLVLLAGCGLLAFSGCQSNAEPLVEPMVARFYLEARPGEAASVAELPTSKVRVNVSPKPVLTEYDVANVDVVKIDLGWCLLFAFNDAAARDLFKLSSQAHGRRLLLTLNNVAVGAHVIDQAVPAGVLPVFVEVPDEELPSIADRLRRTSAGLQGKAR